MMARYGAVARVGYQRLSAIIPLTMSNITITHIKKTGGPSGIT
jgi:hypothetical protein